MALQVRELPPLRHSIEIRTPGGRPYRWAEDEPDPRNVPRDIRHESTMPGGYSTAECSLPRRAAEAQPDLERLSTMRVNDATGTIVSETRLERAPATSGDDLVITPSAVGWQAALEDDKFAHGIIIDRRLDSWQGPSRARIVQLGSNYSPLNGPDTVPDATNGIPALRLSVSGAIDGPTAGAAEAWYDGGEPNRLGGVHFEASDIRNQSAADTAWEFDAFGSTVDNNDGSMVTVLADQDANSVAFARYTLSAAKRFLFLLNRYNGTSTNTVDRFRLIKSLAVIGDHGLPLQQIGAGQDGYLASDIVQWAVTTFAPKLVIAADAVEPSGFVIPHMDPFVATTAGEIVRQATRFGLQDWAVWDDLGFEWYPRNTRGRKWRARIAPSQLEETGPQIDRLWNSVVVQYQDVDGTARTVGPTGSGAGVTDSTLEDSDLENPANKAGVTRRALLTMGTSTPAGAVELGRRFLEEQKLLDSSGRARLVGHVIDDRGVLHPYSHVRAGDQISFIDANDTSYRRIVRASHSHADRSCAIDIDSPPEGLDALLERLGVVLVPLGI